MKEIILFNKQKTMVDDEDFEWLSGFGNKKWHINRGYASMCDRKKNGYVLMHRLIAKKYFNIKKTEEVDHINHNTLDNQKANLRKCTKGNNLRNKNRGKNNTTGYKGVFYNKVSKKYYSFIVINKKMKFLGSFINIIDAAKTYDIASLIYFKEFANTNFNKNNYNFNNLSIPRSVGKSSNSAKFLGVGTKDNKCWHVRISINGKRKDFGTFYTEEAAARFYDSKRLEIEPDIWIGRLNFPQEHLERINER